MFSLSDRTLLFISSYFPLYLWLIFSNLDYSKIIKCGPILPCFFKDVSLLKIIVLFILILLCFISVIPIRKIIIADGQEELTIGESVQIKPVSDSFMNYLITYLTPLMSFDIQSLQNVVMNFSLFALIGFLYIGGNAIYLNPVLGLFGFKIYECEDFKEGHHIITKLDYNSLQANKGKENGFLRYVISDGVLSIKLS